MYKYREGYNLIKDSCGVNTFGISYGMESDYVPEKIVVIDLPKIGDNEYDAHFKFVELHEARHQVNHKSEYDHRIEVDSLAKDMGLPSFSIEDFMRYS